MTRPSAGAAADRRRVRLADGREATLIYWPVPIEERKPAPGVRRRAHGRARVVIGGRRYTVPAEAVVEVLDA
jgi:hypothetical protein